MTESHGNSESVIDMIMLLKVEYAGASTVLVGKFFLVRKPTLQPRPVNWGL